MHHALITFLLRCRFVKSETRCNAAVALALQARNDIDRGDTRISSQISRLTHFTLLAGFGFAPLLAREGPAALTAQNSCSQSFLTRCFCCC
jgi:hypothetical protein